MRCAHGLSRSRNVSSCPGSPAASQPVDVATLCGLAQPVLPPTWLDLMMWSVTMGSMPLSRLLWEQTISPMRGAIMASKICRRRAEMMEDAEDAEILSEHAATFEGWAVDLLNAIQTSKEARQLLESITTRPAVHAHTELSSPLSAAKSPGGRSPFATPHARKSGVSGPPQPEFVDLWKHSVLDEATQNEAVACKRFAEHRRSQVRKKRDKVSRAVLLTVGERRIPLSAPKLH